MLPLLPPPAIQAQTLAEEVAEAERAFAADAARRGTSAAFVAAFAKEGLVFAPRPENARIRYGRRKEDGSRLAWEPAFVEAAASGDFALSTGPWSWRAEGAAAPAAFGHFLTLWVKRDGRWQVKLDVGVPHPAQAEAPLVLRTHAPAAPGPAPEATWRTFDAAAGSDLAAALKEAGSVDLRLYRPGEAVLPGNLAARAGEEGGAAAWEPLGQAVAGSRDLAVRWGVRARGGARATVVQVRRRDGAAWRLAMDVALPWAAGS